MHHPFLTILPVEELLSFLQTVPPLESEALALDAADGRVLAQDITASEDLPPANRSAMDGYAVLSTDTFGASDSNPVWLELVGEVPIDTPSAHLLHSGACMGIATGSFVPEGADAVVMVEHTAPFSPSCIEVRRSVAPGENIMLQGEDITTGNLALPKGKKIRPQELGLLAALGQTQISVVRRPRVCILSTGDELVPAEQKPPYGKIRDINSTSLAAMARKTGAVVYQAGIIRDDPQVLLEAIRTALSPNTNDIFTESPDVVVLSGGSSAGRHDLTTHTLEQLDNCKIFCHGLALSPGKPTIVAQRSKSLIWGLPGQAGSAQVVMQVLLMPFLRHLGGHTDAFSQKNWPSCKAIVSRNTPSKQGREDYIRVRLLDQGKDLPHAEPVMGLSGLLRTLLQADGLVRIEGSSEGLLAGSEVDVLLF